MHLCLKSRIHEHGSHSHMEAEVHMNAALPLFMHAPLKQQFIFSYIRKTLAAPVCNWTTMPHPLATMMLLRKFFHAQMFWVKKRSNHYLLIYCFVIKLLTVLYSAQEGTNF